MNSRQMEKEIWKEVNAWYWAAPDEVRERLRIEPDDEEVFSRAYERIGDLIMTKIVGNRRFGQ